ncbi:methylated-DNA--[protein]-cysteine S-methyltransferase [Aliamphritea ceti]|uniref:methylated-DNA--[protein]-cysteine S-methyltransferase n=1 Tax=Aliamphritea ceti TaxID=1524258 RepID=UPI0021C2D75F|nr:methylated-DNA--[protein]-cysteine S-methyltransferase [Aliamphritea ceti]
MSTIHIQYYQTPVGELIIGAFNSELCLCDWRYRRMRDQVDNRLKKFFKAEYEQLTDPVIDQTIDQLEDYFSGQRQHFDLPLSLAGSGFQQQVWQALIKVPYGETYSYLQLSELLGNPKAIRAVASANGANAISIIVPCHRIIGSDGSLTGYAGGLPAKEKLLKLEGAELPGQTLELF